MGMILTGGGVGGPQPEVSVWPVVRRAHRHFPVREAAMEAGKMRICFILTQAVGRVRVTEGLAIRGKSMIPF